VDADAAAAAAFLNQIPPESPQQLVAAGLAAGVAVVDGTAAADDDADAAAAAAFLNQSVSGVCAI